MKYAYIIFGNEHYSRVFRRKDVQEHIYSKLKVVGRELYESKFD